MSRDVSRIAPILQLLGEVWNEYSDMRLGQLIENIGIYWYSEDVNENIELICSFAKLPLHKHILWGTRGIDGRSPLVYKRLCDLETSHLKSILVDSKERQYVLSESIIHSIHIILEDRNEK